MDNCISTWTIGRKVWHVSQIGAIYSVEKRGVEEGGQYIYVLRPVSPHGSVLKALGGWIGFWTAFSLLEVVGSDCDREELNKFC